MMKSCDTAKHDVSTDEKNFKSSSKMYFSFKKVIPEKELNVLYNFKGKQTETLYTIKKPRKRLISFTKIYFCLN